MLDHDQIARRQAELSKNLSAAYLNHQIAELENQVRGLPTPAANGQQPKAAAKEKAPARIDDHVSFGGGRIDHEEKERDEDIEVYDELDQEWRVAVVDVSAFMWAPKATKSLIQKGFEIIVPSSGIVTLDLLKKGDSPSAQAARKAARYIEHASRQYKVISSDPSIAIQLGTDYRRGSGLRFQRDEETRQIDELSSLPLMPGEEGPPKWVQSVLGCAAYFVGINKAEIDNAYDKDERELPPALYIACPSFEILSAQDPTAVRPLTRENRDEAEKNGSYAERGEGVILQEEAERFELGIAILRDEDEDRPLNGGDRGNWRNGRGRGGHGEKQRARPRKREEEQIPEVKILLKRPQVAQGDNTLLSEQSDSPPSFTHDLPNVANAPNGIGSSAILNNLSTNSAPSNEISPPILLRKLPEERKSPGSKFVPLTRETHPVRKHAGSDSDDDRPQRERGGRGGRSGRGGGTGKGSGRNKPKERDSEFKGGNFVLLKRPEPAPVAPKNPVPPPVPAPAQAQARQPTILARKPPVPTGTQVQKPASETAQPRTILQRPPRELTPTPAPVSAPVQSQAVPMQSRPPSSDMRGRGRGRGGPRGHFHPHMAIQNRPRPPLPPSASIADTKTFEFDDAMLRPGYGSSTASLVPVVNGPRHADGYAFQLNGREHGNGMARGGFRPPAPPHHHHHHYPHHHHHHGPPGPRPPPGGPLHGHAPAHAHAYHLSNTPLGWEPAEPVRKVVLQRPTS